MAGTASAVHRDLSYPAYNPGQRPVALDEPRRAQAFFARFLELEPAHPQADEIRRLLSRLGGVP